MSDDRSSLGAFGRICMPGISSDRHGFIGITVMVGMC